MSATRYDFGPITNSAIKNAAVIQAIHLIFDRQNKQDVDDFVGIKSGKREKQRRDQHSIGEAAAEEKRRDRGAHHPDEEIKREAERPPARVLDLRR